MRREQLLIGEMIDAATQAQALVAGTDLETLRADRQRRDALLWNFTVLGEAAAQLPDDVKGRFPDVPWAQPARLRNRVLHGYWSIDLEILHTTAADLLPHFVAQLHDVLVVLETDTEEASALEVLPDPPTSTDAAP